MAEPITGVPLLDFTRVSDEEQAALREVFARVLKSGTFILGPEVRAFERECADSIGVRHALGVSSGTDALLLALMALGIGPGDEVICPTYTFFATGGTIWRLGARPVFVDSQPCCYNAGADAIAEKITPATKAIMPVHLYGQCSDMVPILSLGEERGIPVIEDAAQAIGARCTAGTSAGMGLMGCISFYPTKNLSGFGDGGLVTTDDDELQVRLDSLRVHGWGPKYYHKHVGGNFRMDAVQAALLRLRLPRLDAAAERRRENAAFYTRGLTEAGVAIEQPSVCGTAGGEFDLQDKIGLPSRCAPDHTFNQFVLRVPDRIGRDALRQALQDKNIGSEIYYPLCLHQQECFAELSHREGDFPVAEAAARTNLALPVFPGLSRGELQYVVDAIVAAC